jgi:hypothetical protein
MARAGWRHIDNIDYSQVVISHMAQLHKSLPQLTYKVADVRWAGAALTALRSPPCLLTQACTIPAHVLAGSSIAMPSTPQRLVLPSAGNTAACLVLPRKHCI